MKIFVVFLALIGWCAGSALPVVPGDNSHYVEGESRYIWMPDGEGVPHLVDLQAPVDEELLQTRNGADNAYWLFTRGNPTSHQILVNGRANSIRNSNYIGNRPTKVIAHGFLAKGGSELNTAITSAFLAQADVNVIVLDWSRAATGTYGSACRAVPDVGRQLAIFLQFLFDTAGGSWRNVHLVGHSLGAHVVGNAGRAAQVRPARVTGLDPARLNWVGNSDALNRHSAVYVESIHTDGNVMGIMNPISDADFYPNGGSHQPGCQSLSTCSHSRAHQLFASTVRTPSRFVGRRCIDLREAQRVQCSGAQLLMGNSRLDKGGSGIYGLETGSSWPF